jgi:hypothetical protein
MRKRRANGDRVDPAAMLAGLAAEIGAVPPVARRRRRRRRVRPWVLATGVMLAAVSLLYLLA